MSVNKVILVGNVGQDPEVRYLDNGMCVATFSLATSEVYTNKNGEKVTQTEWHSIVLWNKLGQVAENYVTKGKQVYIEGRLRTRNYEDKEGVTRYRTEINGQVMQLLGRKSDDQAGSAGTQVSTSIQSPQSTVAPESAPVAEPSISVTPSVQQNTPSQPTSIVPEEDDDLPF